MRKLACIVVTALLALPVASSCAADAPVGFQLLCLKAPAECRGGGGSILVANDDVLRTLKAVNLEVNSSIRPQRDGVVDVWSVGVNAGDCEDYVLTKRRLLIRAGLPASALRIASVKTRGGEAHAILVVQTTTEAYVLDNLRNVLKPLSQTRYRVVAMSTADPRVWS